MATLVSIQRRHRVCGGTFVRCPFHFRYDYDPYGSFSDSPCEDCQRLIRDVNEADGVVCECWPLWKGTCAGEGYLRRGHRRNGGRECAHCGISENNPEGE